MSNLLTLDQIETSASTRLSTGIPLLNLLFGETYVGPSEEDYDYGMVEGSLVMLAGAAGCGKSRLSIDIASKINKRGNKVLYFLLEANLSDFKGWTKDKVTKPELFLASDETDLDEQVAIIYEHRPKFVVVDSVNKYDVHHSKIKGVIDTLQECARKTGAVIFLIGQLDTKSSQMQVRGSQDWVYLPDVVLHAYKRQLSFKVTSC